MRILHIDTGLTLRGGQTQLMLLGRRLRHRGHDQTIACPADSQLAKSLVSEGFHTLPIARQYWNAVPTLRVFLKAQQHHVVAAHDSRAQTLSYLASFGIRIVRVADRLVAFEPRNRLVHRLKYTRTCDMVIASSQAVKDTMVRNGVDANHVEVIRGGIDFPEVLPPRAEARARMRAKWKLAPDAFVVGHLAAFTAEKGQLQALEALQTLLPRYPQLRMILAGDGPLRSDASMKAKAAEVKGAAVLPGYIQPDADFYAGLDLFVANSTSEALGLAPLYAMAHEVPVVASKVGGLPEVVGNGGWLVPQSDPVALALAIEHAINAPAELAMTVEAARSHAREFSADVTAERTEALYKRLVDGSH